jgi:hypothetical protein
VSVVRLLKVRVTEMNEPEKTNISLKSAILLAVIFILGQYVITSWIHDYGHDEKVVSYVSFAGTLVSIILALLAIIYSYYQNFSQKRDSGTISAQIEILRATLLEMRNSQGSFSAEIEKLEEIGRKLDDNTTIVEASRGELKALQETVTSKFADSTASQPPAGPNDLKETLSNLIAKASPPQIAIYAALLKGAKKNMAYRDIVEKILLPAIRPEQQAIETSIKFMCLGIWMMMLDLGFISLKDKKLSMNGNLSDCFNKIDEKLTAEEHSSAQWFDTTKLKMRADNLGRDVTSPD